MVIFIRLELSLYLLSILCSSWLGFAQGTQWWLEVFPFFIFYFLFNFLYGVFLIIWLRFWYLLSPLSMGPLLFCFLSPICLGCSSVAMKELGCVRLYFCCYLLGLKIASIRDGTTCINGSVHISSSFAINESFLPFNLWRQVRLLMVSSKRSWSVFRLVDIRWAWSRLHQCKIHRCGSVVSLYFWMNSYFLLSPAAIVRPEEDFGQKKRICRD